MAGGIITATDHCRAKFKDIGIFCRDSRASCQQKNLIAKRINIELERRRTTGFFSRKKKTVLGRDHDWFRRIFPGTYEIIGFPSAPMCVQAAITGPSVFKMVF